jgi:hypothetical protein
MRMPPEPPIWLGMCLAAIIGFAFIALIILLKTITQ